MTEEQSKQGRWEERGHHRHPKGNQRLNQRRRKEFTRCKHEVKLEKAKGVYKMQTRGTQGRVNTTTRQRKTKGDAD